MTEEQKQSLKNLREKLEKECFPLIPVKTEELLIKLTTARKPQMILELGSGKGYSGSVMLVNSEAGLVTIEKEKATVIIESSHKIEWDLSKDERIFNCNGGFATAHFTVDMPKDETVIFEFTIK